MLQVVSFANGRAGVNDSPVDCQSREVTKPQRDRVLSLRPKLRQWVIPTVLICLTVGRRTARQSRNVKCGIRNAERFFISHFAFRISRFAFNLPAAKFCLKGLCVHCASQALVIEFFGVAPILKSVIPPLYIHRTRQCVST